MFNCKRCGKCCGVVPFSKSEYLCIKETAKQMNVKFIKQDFLGNVCYIPEVFIEKINKIINDNSGLEDLQCPFLDFDVLGKSTCKIYDKRPSVCRLFGTFGDKNKHLKCPHEN